MKMEKLTAKLFDMQNGFDKKIMDVANGFKDDIGEAGKTPLFNQTAHYGQCSGTELTPPKKDYHRTMKYLSGGDSKRPRGGRLYNPQSRKDASNGELAAVSKTRESVKAGSQRQLRPRKP